ncbi:type I-F CRISPR-associated protein Csy2 [Vibrio harveyi]|uniref:type I-F CRISPR-associated protein Csy2 n=1 Tax=Vibrio harveyi TaxID=669 RepID=UPI003CF4636B
MSKTTFLKIPMRVYHANIASNFHVAGLPAMTAVDGFTHNLERKLNQYLPDLEAQVDAWMYVVDGIEYQEGIQRYTCATNTKSEKGKLNAPMEDNKLATIDQTILIQVTSNARVVELRTLLEEGRMNAVFNRLMFAGGSTGVRISANSLVNKNRKVEFYETVEQAFERHSRGSMVIEDKTHILNELGSGEERLSRLIGLISRKKNKEVNSDKKETEKQELSDSVEVEEYLGNLVPVAIGYQRLGEASLKEGARNPECKHFYAEPVIGMARTRTVASMLANLNSKEDTCYPFWQNAKLNPENELADELYCVHRLTE